MYEYKGRRVVFSIQPASTVLPSPPSSRITGTRQGNTADLGEIQLPCYLATMGLKKGNIFIIRERNKDVEGRECGIIYRGKTLPAFAWRNGVLRGKKSGYSVSQQSFQPGVSEYKSDPLPHQQTCSVLCSETFGATNKRKKSNFYEGFLY
jgi:hypothetical protein